VQEDVDDGSFVRAVVYSTNGDMLATAGLDSKINVYSVANDFSHMRTMEGHTGYVGSLFFSPDSTRHGRSRSGTPRRWNSSSQSTHIQLA